MYTMGPKPFWKTYQCDVKWNNLYHQMIESEKDI